MPRPRRHGFGLGVMRRYGKRGPRGSLFRARNARYLPGDGGRLWALLGRSKYNALPVPASSVPASDDDTSKHIAAVNFDDGTGYLIVHKGASLFEGSLVASGSFAEARKLFTGSAAPANTPRGWSESYLDTFYYVAGQEGLTDHSWARTSAGWRRMGFRLDTATWVFTLSEVNPGSGSITSTEDVTYLIRLYDDSKDIESRVIHSATLSNLDADAVRLTFTNAITLASGEIGTHIRVYRSLLDEPAGIYYRVDPQMAGYESGKGLPLSLFASAGATVDDSASNTQAQINGTVRADGEEGTLAWAEHGGEVPKAGGQVVFRDTMVWWDVQGRPGDLLYSAKGFVEQCPVNLDGTYQYFLPITTGEVDRVLFCAVAGERLVVFTGTSIHRITQLPTYADPGFSRDQQDEVSTQDGICGKRAGAAFGLRPDAAQLILYVSPVHGPSVTDGVWKKQLIPSLDWQSLVDPTKLADVEVVDYPKFQELRIFYTPTGGNSNTQAIIVSYAGMEQGGGVPDYRVTWPVDVKSLAAVYATATDSVRRMWILDSEHFVWVEDSGSTDGQKNYNAAGDIRLEWYTARDDMGSLAHAEYVGRGMVYGTSGVERTFTFKHYALDGDDDYGVEDTAKVGAGELVDEYDADAGGQAHRVEIEYQGPTGSSYDEGASQAPGIREIQWEVQRQGPQSRTR